MGSARALFRDEYARMARDHWLVYVIDGATPAEATDAVPGPLDAHDPASPRHVAVVLGMAVTAWRVGRLDADLRERASGFSAKAARRRWMLHFAGAAR
jgi:hypothetical protein